MTQRSVAGSAVRNVRVLAVLVVAGFLLTACGGGSKPSAAGSVTPSVQTTSAASTPSPSSATTTASTSGSNSGDPLCAKGKTSSSQAAAAVRAYSGDTPAQLEAFEEKELAAVAAFAATAPSAIRSSIEVVVGIDQKFFNVLKAAKFNFRAVSPSALGSLNTPAFVKANKNIIHYLQVKCGITEP